ncbi:replication associated protein [Chaetoceros tenuissimus]|uniref:Replication associated protein n=1 Tax=Chaetoceros tenuissimus TaxID=426638 RepID=A0AAD3DCM5_9STRA|nr:replication associated protein [Chaetoceros tenuissimus]
MEQNYKGDRTSVRRRVDWINSKPTDWTWAQILHENNESKYLLAACSWGRKYHKSRSASAPRRTIQNVILIYGAPSTGKTTAAIDWDRQDNESEGARYFRRNMDFGKFWGGGTAAYLGQRIIHYEEFNGKEEFHKFKEICDIGQVGPRVKIKGSSIELNHETVIVTSHVHPAGWYDSYWKGY